MSPHIIYIVVASSGEYSDFAEWFVCWRPTADEASQVARTCAEQASVILHRYWQLQGARHFTWRVPGEGSLAARQALKSDVEASLDRNQTGHSDGLRYDVFSLADDPTMKPELCASFVVDEIPHP